MDSKKALKILIVLIAVVNIFMAGYIIKLTFSESGPVKEYKYIESLLAYRDIALECDIPDYPASSTVIIAGQTDNSELLSYLKGLESVVFDDEDTGVIVFNPVVNQRFEDLTLDTATEQVELFISSLPVKSQSYILDSILTAGVNVYRFNYIYSDGSSYIYDKTIEVTISKNGIDQAVISNISYTVSDTEFARPLVSIGNILVSGFTRQGQSFIFIKKIDSGYLYDINDKVIKNVWRVMYNNGQERYFSSIDGIEITSD